MIFIVTVDYKKRYIDYKEKREQMQELRVLVEINLNVTNVCYAMIFS
jgi:hypothetical protein